MNVFRHEVLLQMSSKCPIYTPLLAFWLSLWRACVCVHVAMTLSSHYALHRGVWSERSLELMSLYFQRCLHYEYNGCWIDLLSIIWLIISTAIDFFSINRWLCEESKSFIKMSEFIYFLSLRLACRNRAQLPAWDAVTYGYCSFSPWLSALQITLVLYIDKFGR